MKKLFQNENGISMVQVMVALGMAGVLSYMVMGIMDQMNRSQITAVSNQEVTEVFGHFGTIFSNKDYCNNTLGPIKLGDTLNILRYSDDLSAPPFAEAGKPFRGGKVQIEQMKVLDLTESGEVVDDTGELNIHFDLRVRKLHSRILGGAEVKKVFSPRIKLGHITFETDLFCPGAKLRCTNSGSGAQVLKTGDNEFADQSPESDDGCEPMDDSGTTYFQVSCFTPATPATASTALIFKCMI